MQVQVFVYTRARADHLFPVSGNGPCEIIVRESVALSLEVAVAQKCKIYPVVCIAFSTLSCLAFCNSSAVNCIPEAYIYI